MAVQVLEERKREAKSFRSVGLRWRGNFPSLYQSRPQPRDAARQQICLALKMRIKSRPADPGPVKKLLDCKFLVAFLHEQRNQCVEQQFACSLRAAIRFSGRHRLGSEQITRGYSKSNKEAIIVLYSYLAPQYVRADDHWQASTLEPSQMTGNMDTAVGTAAGASRRNDVFAGVLISGCAALALLALANHPTVSATNAEGAVRGLLAIRKAAGLVHGIVSAAIVGLVIGLHYLSTRLGIGRPIVLGARISYFVGATFGLFVATLDGFVTPDLAARCIATHLECYASVAELMKFCAILIQDFTKLALIAQSTGVFCWSLALFAGFGRLGRVVASLGIVAGLVPLVVIVFTTLTLTPHSLVALFVLQTVWYLAVATLLIAGKDCTNTGGGRKPRSENYFTSVSTSL